MYFFSDPPSLKGITVAMPMVSSCGAGTRNDMHMPSSESKSRESPIRPPWTPQFPAIPQSASGEAMCQVKAKPTPTKQCVPRCRCMYFFSDPPFLKGTTVAMPMVPSCGAGARNDMHMPSNESTYGERPMFWSTVSSCLRRAHHTKAIELLLYVAQLCR